MKDWERKEIYKEKIIKRLDGLDVNKMFKLYEYLTSIR